MTLRVSAILAVAILAGPGMLAQKADEHVVSVKAPVVVLQHARIIDGLGQAPSLDQAIVIKEGKIAAVGSTASLAPEQGAQVLDLTGKTVIPGFVMVHEHLYYSSIYKGPFHLNEMDYSFPRLYLAAGVTSIRTGGSIEPYTDLQVKTNVDAGRSPGPKIHLTMPYLDGEGTGITQLRPVASAAAAVRMIDYWADEGFTSAKMYINLPADIMGPAIAEAHKRGMQVTGHIGKVSYREAADLGIDNLEHGFMAMSDFIAGRSPGDPSNPVGTYRSLEVLNPDGPEVTALVQYLVSKHVAVTSTLAIFETFTPGTPIDDGDELGALSPALRETYLANWSRVNKRNNPMSVHAFAKDMAIEKEFFKAGGLLVVGTDPTGYGGVIAGYGSLRAIELLVDEGLTPIEAIQVATLNGAKLLGVDKETGSIEVDKAADLVVIAGDPSTSIADLRKVETVFKDGVGYDSKKLMDSVAGSVGIQ